MKKLLPLLLLSLLLSGCAETPPPETTTPPTIAVTEPTLPAETIPPTEAPSLPYGPGDHLLRYDSSEYGDYLEYYLHIPENAQPGMPFIIFLHGDGEVGNLEGLSCYGLMAAAKEIYGENYPFIAITPCTRTISWVKDSIHGTLTELIEDVIGSCMADREKIIITGHSRGAIGTWNLISLYGDYFSAAVPISCDCGDRIINYASAAQVPLWAFVGSEGDLDQKYVRSMGYMCDQVTAAGGSAQFTILWGDYHNDTCKNAFTPELFQWMLEQ